MESEMDLLNLKVQSSTPSTKPSKPQKDIHYALVKVREMMGYLRKGEANDPVRYPLALAEILSDFPRPVIDKITSTHGLASKLDFMPTLRELKEECEEEARLYEASRKPKFTYRAPEHRPPSFAPNTFIPEGSPHYQTMVAMSEHPSAKHLKLSRFEDRHDKDGVITHGIMVPYGWWEEVNSAATSKKAEKEEDFPF